MNVSVIGLQKLRGKIVSYDEQFDDMRENIKKITKKVMSIESNGAFNKTTYTGQSASNQVVEGSSLNDFQNCRFSMSPVQSTDNNASGGTIELGDMSRAPAKKGEGFLS